MDLKSTLTFITILGLVEYNAAFVVPRANYRLMNVDDYPIPPPDYYHHMPPSYYNSYRSLAMPTPLVHDDSLEDLNGQIPNLKFIDRDEIKQILESSFFARYPVGSVSSMNLKLIMNKVKRIYHDVPQTLKDKSKYEYSLGVEGNVLTLFVTLRADNACETEEPCNCESEEVISEEETPTEPSTTASTVTEPEAPSTTVEAIETSQQPSAETTEPEVVEHHTEPVAPERPETEAPESPSEPESDEKPEPTVEHKEPTEPETEEPKVEEPAEPAAEEPEEPQVEVEEPEIEQAEPTEHDETTEGVYTEHPEATEPVSEEFPQTETVEYDVLPESAEPEHPQFEEVEVPETEAPVSEETEQPVRHTEPVESEEVEQPTEEVSHATEAASTEYTEPHRSTEEDVGTSPVPESEEIAVPESTEESPIVTTTTEAIEPASEEQYEAEQHIVCITIPKRKTEKLLYALSELGDDAKIVSVTDA